MYDTGINSYIALVSKSEAARVTNDDVKVLQMMTSRFCRVMKLQVAEL
jgi:hypothetical protein